jgi:serine/threonine protein kinase
MSPESLKDLVYNEKTDVWSYGCTAYEIVFGQTPFEGIDLVTVVNRVRDHHSTPLDERPSDSDPPAWMWKLMEMCFEFNPQKRPTFKEIIEYLGQNAPQQVLAVEKRLERNRKKREKILQAIQDITV